MRLHSITAALLLLSSLQGCVVGHQDFINFRNKWIGETFPLDDDYRPKNAGKFVRAKFVIAGEGITHITTSPNGDLIYHLSGQEVLANARDQKLVGKCLTYYVVDPKTKIVKAWGFDEGGNPQSCRTWP